MPPRTGSARREPSCQCGDACSARSASGTLQCAAGSDSAIIIEPPVTLPNCQRLLRCTVVCNDEAQSHGFHLAILTQSGALPLSEESNVFDEAAAGIKQVAELRGRLEPVVIPQNVEATSGSIEDDPEFEEIVRLGREYRRQANGEDR